MPNCYTRAMHEDRAVKQALDQTTGHRIEIVRDDGDYRHLRFRNPLWGITWGFDLITWPQHLTIAGDLGVRTFVWNNADALRLFRPGLDEFEYIAGKVAGGRAATMAWSREAFESMLRDAGKEWIESYGASADLDAAIEAVIAERPARYDDAVSSVEANLDGAHFEGTVTDDDLGTATDTHRFSMEGSSIWDCRAYDPQFIIQVTAIIIGVRLYDEHMAAITPDSIRAAA